MSIFICVVVRAIHSEMLADLSANEFLLGLRRFISRPIILDNATQFKLTKSIIDPTLEKWQKIRDVQSYVVEQWIELLFIIE